MRRLCSTPSRKRLKTIQQNLKSGIQDFVLGIPRKYFYDDLDPEIAQAVENAIDLWRRTQKPFARSSAQSSRTAQSSTRSRAPTIATKSLRQRDLYDPETLRRLKTGEGVSDTQYQNALSHLRDTRQKIGEMFRDVDLLLTPTTPVPTPRIADLLKDMSMLRPAEILLLRNTRPVNAWGLPAISVPCGFTSARLADWTADYRAAAR